MAVFLGSVASGKTTSHVAATAVSAAAAAPLSHAAFACIYGLCDGTPKIAGLAVCAGLVLAFSAAIHFCCTQHDRPKYRVPFFPYLPAASLLLNCFLMASLPARAYWQLAVFFGIMIVFYLLYSIHAATRFEQEAPSTGGVEVGAKAVDLEHGPGDAAAMSESAHRGQEGLGAVSIKHTDSIIERINTAPASPRQSVLGRRSGGVTRLPPPTL
jgi:hypothetical protein